MQVGIAYHAGQTGELGLLLYRKSDRELIGYRTSRTDLTVTSGLDDLTVSSLFANQLLHVNSCNEISRVT